MVLRWVTGYRFDQTQLPFLYGHSRAGGNPLAAVRWAANLAAPPATYTRTTKPQGSLPVRICHELRVQEDSGKSVYGILAGFVTKFVRSRGGSQGGVGFLAGLVSDEDRGEYGGREGAQNIRELVADAGR